MFVNSEMQDSLVAQHTMAAMTPKGWKYDGLVAKADAQWKNLVEQMATDQGHSEEDRKVLVPKVVDVFVGQFFWDTPAVPTKHQCEHKLKENVEIKKTVRHNDVDTLRPDIKAMALLEQVLEVLALMKTDAVKRKLFTADSPQLDTPVKRSSLSRGLSALEMSCVRAMGEGTTPTMSEVTMDYVAGEGARLDVQTIMKGHDVPWDAIPDKAVFVVLMAGKQMAEMKSKEAPGKWHTFIDLTECRPGYISTAALFGKQTGPELDAANWGEPDMINCMRSMLNAKAEKPMFFQSSSQFWACLERFFVAAEAVGMMDKKMVRNYRFFLLQRQEEWRLEQRPPMFLWLYDHVVRKQLAVRLELGDPTLKVDTLLTEKDTKIMAITTGMMPKFQAHYPMADGGEYPPVPPMMMPGSGDALAQQQAFMGNANAVLADMKVQAERGAGSVVKSTQLQAEFAAKAAAAAEAHSTGNVRRDGGKGAGKSGKSGKSGSKKQNVQNPPGTGRKYFGSDGKQLTGRKRKAAFQQYAKGYKKQKAAQWKAAWHN